ncbi:conserved hypothetical protein [Neospora caninum Liverpool]|uniref:Uncharacterized protein n=1 Tax=Neospora caninum (strain Liverpool) TaxID=572307 RepID=F0VH38_NEOCL|nr:conserved hypothetical protein [Neospora caninum Liverpool]CBZ53032.1 conserved hypothetical protein [Neospora caninum Liverpool]|eukprot:XP_003883064.1 conserved hypothetical protein [Neospora caninum Liverpool]
MVDTAGASATEVGPASPHSSEPPAGTKRRQTLGAHELRDLQEGKALGDAADDSQPADDMKQADAATLQKRQRLRVVRSGTAVPTPAADAATVSPATTGNPSLAEKPGESPKPVEEGTSPENTNEQAKNTNRAEGEGATNGAPASSENGKEGERASPQEQSATTGLLGTAEIKSVPTFSSAFASLSKQPQSSFFLLSPPQSSTGGAETSSGSTPSLFANLGGSSSLFATSTSFNGNEEGADGEDEQKPEEPSVIENARLPYAAVRRQSDGLGAQTTPGGTGANLGKQTNDGLIWNVLHCISLQKEEDSGATRILFFVHRTGRLHLNTPLIASVNYEHPLDRSRQRAAVSSKDEKPDEKSGEDPQTEDVPRKKNTAQFLGLKTDAKSSSDTTIYRIRFSNEEKCAEFLSLANERKTMGRNQSPTSA